MSPGGSEASLEVDAVSGGAGLGEDRTGLSEVSKTLALSFFRRTQR